MHQKYREFLSNIFYFIIEDPVVSILERQLCDNFSGQFSTWLDFFTCLLPLLLLNTVFLCGEPLMILYRCHRNMQPKKRNNYLGSSYIV